MSSIDYPPDHPQRVELAGEVHARPPGPVTTPSRASYVAVLVAAEARAAETRHLQALCRRWDVAPPSQEATHFRAQLGALRLKWERHGEFSGYTFFVDGLPETPFESTAISSLPAGWLSAIPGQTVAAVHAEITSGDARVPDPDALARRFGNAAVVGSSVAEGAGMLFTDFRLQDDGCSRVWLVNERLTPTQAGRIVQRMFEIEVYRVLALLALPIARRQTPRIAAIEQALATLTDQMATHDDAAGPGKDASQRDEALLHELMMLAAEVESGIAASQFRFGACEAYHGLVRSRIAELREQRLAGLQTIDEFMGRRLAPAAATCATTAQRLRSLAERIGQTSALLATRVGIANERQNQGLLASMNQHARLQLRLQQTVEGLSVAAIVYYAAGLTGYVAKALRGVGLQIEPDLVVGVSIPLLAALLLWSMRRMRARLGIEPH
ncbi:MAG: hypothetical protein RIS35_652 [Pseudomonadota bacterium]|jgi:uncharacterized membrane-anchored protein